MKRLFVTILIAASILTGCATQSASNDRNTTRFTVLKDVYMIGSWPVTIAVDNVTSVVYIYRDGINTISISPLYGKNGKPMTLKEYEQSKIDEMKLKGE